MPSVGAPVPAPAPPADSDADRRHVGRRRTRPVVGDRCRRIGLAGARLPVHRRRRRVVHRPGRHRRVPHRRAAAADPDDDAAHTIRCRPAAVPTTIVFDITPLEPLVGRPLDEFTAAAEALGGTVRVVEADGVQLGVDLDFAGHPDQRRRRGWLRRPDRGHVPARPGVERRRAWISRGTSSVQRRSGPGASHSMATG